MQQGPQHSNVQGRSPLDVKMVSTDYEWVCTCGLEVSVT